MFAMGSPSLVFALFSAGCISLIHAQEPNPKRTSTVTVTVTNPYPSQNLPAQQFTPGPSRSTSFPALDNLRGTRNSNPYAASLASTAPSNPNSNPWSVANGAPYSPNSPSPTGWSVPSGESAPRAGSPWDSSVSLGRSTSWGPKSVATSSSRGISAYFAAPTARVEGGMILGSTVQLPKPAARVHQFLGIPFSDPPKRWNAPGAVQRWIGRRDATKIKPACIQQFNVAPNREFTTTVFNNPAPVESEDCLYLNVYAPAEQASVGRGRAVLFWLYGGSLQFGHAGMPGYNGSYFAGYQDVVVVTANYRTNVFGFPTSPEIPPRERNLGFLDQRAALEWVKNNIEEFGGDPAKVTIFGESAGAASIDALVTSYSRTSVLRPPFRAAILQSGNIGIRRITATQSSKFSDWDKLAAEAECSGTSSAILTCLRRLPAQTLKTIMEANNLNFRPTTDNFTLVATPELKRRTGQLHSFPVMVGSNAEEGRVFQINQNNLTKYLETTFPNDPALHQRIREAYPRGQNGLNSDYDIQSQIMTDVQFGCPASLFAYDSVKGGYPTWRYFFNATFPNLQKFENAGAYHASEIELIFGTYGKLPTAVSARPSTDDEISLSASMQTAWAAFAKNPTRGPGWVEYGKAPLDVANFGGPEAKGGISLIRSNVIDSKCVVFASLY